MVGEHNAACSDADRLGAAGNVTNADRCGSASYAREVVMFGHPESIVARGLSVLCQVEGVYESIGRSEALADVGKV